MTFLETPLNINTELAIRLPSCLQREVKLLRGLHPSSMAGPSTAGGGFPAQPRGTEKGEGDRLLSSPLTWQHRPLFHHLISLNPHTEETNSSHPITGQFLILKISVYCPNHSGFFFLIYYLINLQHFFISWALNSMFVHLQVSVNAMSTVKAGNKKPECW